MRKSYYDTVTYIIQNMCPVQEFLGDSWWSRNPTGISVYWVWDPFFVWCIDQESFCWCSNSGRYLVMRSQEEASCLTGWPQHGVVVVWVATRETGVGTLGGNGCIQNYLFWQAERSGNHRGKSREAMAGKNVQNVGVRRLDLSWIDQRIKYRTFNDVVTDRKMEKKLRWVPWSIKYAY